MERERSERIENRFKKIARVVVLGSAMGMAVLERGDRLMETAKNDPDGLNEPAKVESGEKQIDEAREIYGQVLFQNETRQKSRQEAKQDIDRVIKSIPTPTPTPEFFKAAVAEPVYQESETGETLVDVTHFGCEGDGTGKYCGTTASGKQVAPEIAACGPSHLGDLVVIDNITFECADTGGAVGNYDVDIWCQNTGNPSRWGPPGTPEYDLPCPVESGTQTATFITTSD